jgi:hypothetical protein
MADTLDFSNEGPLGRALRKRLDDWYGSTSAFYAAERDDDGESWREGIVGYMLRGPGSLADTLVRKYPDD